MNRLPLLLCAALLGACGSPDTAPPAMKEQPEDRPLIHEESFFGEVTQADVYFGIHLPKNYFTEERRYPVVFFFHGKGWGTASSKIPPHPVAVEAFQRMMDEGLVDDFVHVTVHGKLDTFFANAASDASLQIETNLMEEVIPYLEEKYRVIPRREGRALLGFSMGANAALTYQLKFPESFAVSVALDGGYRRWDGMVEEHSEVTRKMFDDDEANFEEFCPFFLIEQNAKQLRASANLLLMEGAITDEPLIQFLDAHRVPYRHEEITRAHNLADVLEDAEPVIAEYLTTHLDFENAD